jgi:hypothetical protein
VRHSIIRLAVLVAGVSLSLHAQRGGFVMTLGRDTVQVEQFERHGDTVTSIVATRSPTARLQRIVVRLDEEGRLLSFERRLANGLGEKRTPDRGLATFRWERDSVTREFTENGRAQTLRTSAARGTVPFGTIPLESPFVLLEAAFVERRDTTPAEQQTFDRLAFFSAMNAPSRTRLLSVAKDSVVVDYFGQGSWSAFFDAKGRLVRSDWSRTTYHVRVVRVPAIDAELFARRWADEDARAIGVGPLSPRDTVRGVVNGLHVVIAYGRPSARGREIWGGVVPWGQVWRLGADASTHLSIDGPLRIGDKIALPAGEYSLWMQPEADGNARLIFNQKARAFGTQYESRYDLLTLPMERELLPQPVERLTITIESDAIVIAWATTRFRLRVQPDSGASLIGGSYGAHVKRGAPHGQVTEVRPLRVTVEIRRREPPISFRPTFH